MPFREKESQLLHERSERVSKQFNALLEKDEAPFRFLHFHTFRMSLHIFMPGHSRDRWEIRGVDVQEIKEGEEEAYYHAHFQEWKEAYERRLTQKQSGAYYGDSDGYNLFGGRHE